MPSKEDDNAILTIGKFPYFEENPMKMPRLLATGYEHEIRKATRG